MSEAGGGFSVALADAEPEVRRTARAVLEGLGGVVIEVSNGETLEAIVTDFCVDLVVTGVPLAAATGVEVLRRCRRRGDRTPFVLMSPNVDEHLWCAIDLPLVTLVAAPAREDALVTALRSVRQRQREGRAPAPEAAQALSSEASAAASAAASGDDGRA